MIKSKMRIGLLWTTVAVAVAVVAGNTLVPVALASPAAKWPGLKWTLGKDLDNPAQQPIQVGLWGETISAGEYYFGPQTVYHVPPGKRLVVEYVEGSAQAPDGQKPALLLLAPAPGWGNIIYDAEQRGVSYTFHQTVRIYYGPDEDVVMRAYRNRGDGDAYCFFTIHGYLVDLTL